jgi:hypothetical protein
MDDACVWQVTQMMPGATVGDLVRGIVKLCNLKGGAFALGAPWQPRRRPLLARPPSASAAPSGGGSDTDAAAPAPALLLPPAELAAAVGVGYAVGDDGVATDALRVDAIASLSTSPAGQAAAAVAAAAAAAAAAASIVTRDGEVIAPLRVRTPPAAAAAAVSGRTLPPAARPADFELRVLEDGAPDMELPTLPPLRPVADVGERNFALCAAADGAHALDVRVEPSRSSRGAAVLIISFRRPRRLLLLALADASGGRTSADAARGTGASSSSPAPRTGGAGAAPARRRLAGDDSADDVGLEATDDGAGGGAAAALGRAIPPSPARLLPYAPSGGGGSGGGSTQGRADAPQDEPEMSFDEWYAQAYPDGEPAEPPATASAGRCRCRCRC